MEKIDSISVRNNNVNPAMVFDFILNECYDLKDPQTFRGELFFDALNVSKFCIEDYYNGIYWTISPSGTQFNYSKEEITLEEPMSTYCFKLSENEKELNIYYVEDNDES